MIDIETGLSKRLNRKNPAQHLPAVLRAVASFAIDPPEMFTTVEVSRRTLPSSDMPHGLGTHLVGKEMYSLMSFDLVQRAQGGYPYDPSMRSVIYSRSNPERWDIAMQVLDTLRPIEITEIEQPPQ